ncbi:MAG: SpoIIE family protein phosphatase, partial [Bacteroidetes bacterium]|nr:SpoIIE family protein phosphatase [Bacteroidota bacterium]
GDFYWSFEKDNFWYLAAVDCTGHGVPGAFMSMLGIAFLNEITAVDKMLTPSEILDSLRSKIIKEMGQTGRMGENKDGMDISLIRLNLTTHELQWAGAYNPLWIINNRKELIEIKGDKQPIGFSHNQNPFSNHVIPLNKEDTFYIFTDGYADQFGGVKGKKFKYMKLKEVLFTVNDRAMTEQKQILDENFENWRGSLEQVDDVCVIGVRL